MKLEELSNAIVPRYPESEVVDDEELNDGEKKAKKIRRKWKHAKKMRTPTSGDAGVLVKSNDPSAGHGPVNGPYK